MSFCNSFSAAPLPVFILMILWSDFSCVIISLLRNRRSSGRPENGYVIPSEEEMTLINERIAKELECGIVKDSTRAELVSIITRMRDQDGIEAVILGCTELPLILNAENCPTDCLDIMQIHISRLVNLVLEE